MTTPVSPIAIRVSPIATHVSMCCARSRSSPFSSTMCRARSFENLTYKNFGFSDAAEAFVLISGISVALAYGTKFQPGGRLACDPEDVAAGRRALRRPHRHDHGGDRPVLRRGGVRQAAGTADADQHRAVDEEHAGSAGRHRHARPSARLQQHPAGLCGAASDGAGLRPVDQLQACRGACRVRRAVAGRRHLADRPAQLSRARLLVPQPAVLAVPVQHRPWPPCCMSGAAASFRSTAGWSARPRPMW